MMSSKICIAQELLLKWMACGEKKRSYESIRRNCEYLDQAYELGLGNNAIWALFHPLFRTGVIEFTGKDCYALSPTIAIESDGHFIYNSPLPQKKTNSTKFTGFDTLLCKTVVAVTCYCKSVNRTALASSLHNMNNLSII